MKAFLVSRDVAAPSGRSVAQIAELHVDDAPAAVSPLHSLWLSLVDGMTLELVDMMKRQISLSHDPCPESSGTKGTATR